MDFLTGVLVLIAIVSILQLFVYALLAYAVYKIYNAASAIREAGEGLKEFTPAELGQMQQNNFGPDDLDEWIYDND